MRENTSPVLKAYSTRLEEENASHCHLAAGYSSFKNETAHDITKGKKIKNGKPRCRLIASSLTEIMKKAVDFKVHEYVVLLYLTLDINSHKCGFLSGLKKVQSFASKKPYAIVSLLEIDLAIVFTYKSGALVIGFKAKLFCKETKPHIWLISAKGFSISQPICTLDLRPANI